MIVLELTQISKSSRRIKLCTEQDFVGRIHDKQNEMSFHSFNVYGVQIRYHYSEGEAVSKLYFRWHFQQRRFRIYSKALKLLNLGHRKSSISDLIMQNWTSRKSSIPWLINNEGVHTYPMESIETLLLHQLNLLATSEKVPQAR